PFLLRRFLADSLHNFRQTRQHSLTNYLHALRRHFVDRVVSFVPVRITGELYQINRSDARMQKRFMIVSADAFFTFDEHLVVSELAPGLPDDVLQPARARVVAAELEIFITHHVEQNERACIREFVSFAQQGNVMTAAVRVVWTTM